MNISHIINPVKVTKSSDLYEAQPVTFRTLLKAKNDSIYKDSIKQYVIGYSEDTPVFPAGFEILKPLERSVMDYGSFSKQRKLPLITDILNALKEINTDYIIYTNVDIAVLPFFYDYIYSKLQDGSDSLIINRRVVASLKDDAIMFAELGQSHPGYDCFVFRKALLSKFIFGSTCIGANFIGRAMYTNLMVFSEKLEIVKDAHLTFHIGEDGAWLLNDFSKFDNHNKKEVSKLIASLLKITQEESKIKELQKVLHFMDNFQLKKPKPLVKKPLKQRVKSRLKKIIHAFYK
ncbi:hypothetical protein [Aequorivita antarctica]|uniref:Glycosyltransferase family 2 protein n=1 Tax=Aequorivita antarctica TaxID=153266 RepID=A0A5C6YXT5_9FLAO|nr:hypothetical protein [Aequorivita antarctica]TXD72510.1 hypothetical protein ESU54_11900 [Aequorivita antarctica]SRX75396.1 hypothetical protein AEQU3_02390 [Aequorivita antarctica]